MQQNHYSVLIFSRRLQTDPSCLFCSEGHFQESLPPQTEAGCRFPAFLQVLTATDTCEVLMWADMTNRVGCVGAGVQL